MNARTLEEKKKMNSKQTIPQPFVFSHSVLNLRNSHSHSDRHQQPADSDHQLEQRRRRNQLLQSAMRPTSAPPKTTKKVRDATQKMKDAIRAREEQKLAEAAEEREKLKSREVDTAILRKRVQQSARAYLRVSNISAAQ
eukprot:GHVQ01013645.1.p1 GENE.GHVQ01013645.1~~GHVQ01013645.1.p1  ORF type:complete len:139 (-),score=19.70 GHVQ01013645.1:1359-1775(-)